MSNLKILKLEYWMSTCSLFSDDLDYYYEIKPIFNRDGWYLENDRCWFEVNNRAFEGSDLIESFKYKLYLLDIPCLTDKEIKALTLICETKLASKNQHDIIKIYNTLKDYRSMKLAIIKSLTNKKSVV